LLCRDRAVIKKEKEYIRNHEKLYVVFTVMHLSHHCTLTC